MSHPHPEISKLKDEMGMYEVGTYHSHPTDMPPGGKDIKNFFENPREKCMYVITPNYVYRMEKNPRWAHVMERRGKAYTEAAIEQALWEKAHKRVAEIARRKVREAKEHGRPAPAFDKDLYDPASGGAMWLGAGEKAPQMKLDAIRRWKRVLGKIEETGIWKKRVPTFFTIERVPREEAR